MATDDVVTMTCTGCHVRFIRLGVQLVEASPPTQIPQAVARRREDD